MDELLARLQKALEVAEHACCVTRPNAGDDLGYHLGRLQGKVAGLTDALAMVTDFAQEDQGDFGDDNEQQRVA